MPTIQSGGNSIDPIARIRLMSIAQVAPGQYSTFGHRMRPYDASPKGFDKGQK